MKKLISLILLFAMITSMFVFPVSAVTSDTTELTELCPCGCGVTLSEVQWREWDPNTNGDPEPGHYYLADDYVQEEQLSIISGNKVVLDLRGYTLTTDGYHRLFLLYGYLAVMDSVGGGRFSAKTSGAGYGGIVMVSTNETNDPTFELYSGTITPDADNKASRRGGLIHLAENSTFRMYGGRLMNGSTVNGNYKEPGGAVAGNSKTARIEILGGEILGCESSTYGGSIYNTGTTVLKDCTIIGGVAASGGGNVCQNGGSLTVENCTIADGVSNGKTNGGGNICVMSSTVLTVKDSTIRNGNSGNYGGNLYMGTASGSIENTEIYSGVATSRGNNIYGSASVTSLTIKDCQLPGDVAYVGSNLTLEGLVKIGLLNNGLKLWYGTTAVAVSASGLTEGSEIYVDANGTFTEAGANAAYFKGALRTVLSETEQGLVGTQAAAGEQGGYCPHCGQQVTWKAYSITDSLVQDCLLDSADDTDPACTGRHITSGHYYLESSLTDAAQYYIGAFLSASGTLRTDDVVVDFNGCDITANGRVFYLRPKDTDGNANQLTLMDSVGGSTLTGSGSGNQGGGVLYNEGSELTVYGGKYVYAPSGTRNVTNGGVVYNGGTFNLHGGILDGSAYAYTDQSTDTKTYTYYGGALYQGGGNTKVLNMTAGRLMGGTAQSGGTAFFSYNNQLNITGGQFFGGTADVDNGGCIRLYSAKVSGAYQTAGVFNLSNASVTGGSATTAGGNLYIHYYTANLDNCYIAGGHSDDYGGNINCGTSSTDNIMDCRVLNGSANRGANIYVAATSATVKLDGNLVTNGTATTYGGNIHAGNGNIDIVGGEISFGTAGSYAGNISANAGNASATSKNYTRISTDEEGNAPLIAGGTAKTYGGNLYAVGVLYLDAAQLQNGTAGTLGQDIYLAKASKQGRLEISGNLTGDISMGASSALLGENVYGEAIGNTVCDTLNANITLEGSYGEPLLCAKDGALYVGAVAVENAAGDITWYTDTATAIAACDESSFVKLYAPQDVVLTKDCAVDINGQSVNVSGAYTLYGMDSSGDSFSVPTGIAAVAEETTVAQDHTAPNTYRYLTTSDENGTVFHRVRVQVTDVSIRPSADGMYYTGIWSCDEVIAANIETYGVAVSIVNMPGADFAEDEDTLCTTYTASGFVSGEKKPGALVSGILKNDGRDPKLNSAYGQMPVFAAAYITFTDGTVLLSDTESHDDDVAYSLQSLMATMDALIEADPHNYRVLTMPLRGFYEKWLDNGMGDWEFNKIPKPEDDGVIDILMIGGSFSYYYVEELYGMAAAAGIPMRVCNLYYSGAGPQQHWTWWKNGQSPCQFFNTDGNGRVCTNNVSLEWALAQDDWDVLSLQYPSGTVRTETAQEGFDANKLYTDELTAYLKEQFPDAVLYWQQVWAYQVGYDRNGYQVPDRTEQLGLYERHKELAHIACEAYDLPIMPAGEAWELVRQGGYDNLCARLGKGTNHEGDYYHEGDIGGGQYLNACVWFERLTGQSCIGNTYVPTYVYSGQTYGLLDGITVEQLQQAAHQAVEALNEQ